MALDMCPAFAPNYRPNGTLSDTKHLGKFPLGIAFVFYALILSIEPAYFTHLIFCKVCGSHTFANGVKSVLNSMVYVFLMGCIFKIAKGIIPLIGVFMVNFVPIRDWSNKRKQDKAVNSIVRALAALIKAHNLVSPTGRGSEYTSGVPSLRAMQSANITPQTSHPTLTTYLIPSFVSRHIPPLFAHDTSKANSPLTCPESASRRVRQRAADWILSVVKLPGKNPSASTYILAQMNEGSQ